MSLSDPEKCEMQLLFLLQKSHGKIKPTARVGFIFAHGVAFAPQAWREIRKCFVAIWIDKEEKSML